MMPKATSTEYLTVAEVAQRVGVSPDTVLSWLNAGGLRGVDVSRRAEKRARWRVRVEDLDAFLAGRSSCAAPAVGRLRKRRGTAGRVIEFF